MQRGGLARSVTDKGRGQIVSDPPLSTKEGTMKKSIAVMFVAAIALGSCATTQESGELVANAETVTPNTTVPVATLAPTTTEAWATDTEITVLAFQMVMAPQTNAVWADWQVISAGDEVCEQIRRGDWDDGEDALNLADDWYYVHPFFDEVYDLDVAYAAIGGLAVVGGCDAMMDEIIAGWGV
jgi:hypothetical protein